MAFLRFIVRFIIWLLALLGIAVVAAAVVGFLFFNRLVEPNVKIPDQAVLTIDLSQGLVAEHVSLPFAPIGRPTIEDIVREEIRPLLKHWLDTNLPPLVERLVRAEIERVVGRAVP